MAIHERLQARLAQAERVLPGVAISFEDVQHQLSSRDELDPEAMEDEGIVEIALACACVAHDARALAIFEKRYISVIAPALAPMKLDGTTVQDVTQAVRDKLLVADTKHEIKLLRYAGRGTLRGLVKVTAVRMALSLLRKQPDASRSADELDRLADPTDSPELHFLKAHYRKAFRSAFTRAVGQLEDRERNLLRLHLLGGVTLEEIARMYTVNRSTVVRMLQRVRKKLFTTTRDALREDLAIHRSEFDSVLALIRSRFDLSLGRLLETVPPDE